MSAQFDDEKPEAYHWRMNTETRIEKLEANDAGDKVEIATLKANYATKDDIADLKIRIANLENLFSETKVELKAYLKAHDAETKALVAEARASIIAWSVTAIFIAQLLPALLKLFLPG